MNEFGNSSRSARQRRKNVGHLLCKCLALAFAVATSPTAQPQLQRYVRPLDRKVLKMPISPAVPERRPFATPWTNAGVSPNRRDNPTIADPFDTQNSNVRPGANHDFACMPLDIGRRKVDQEGRSPRGLRQSRFNRPR
jgi:hypothetical protein